MARAAVAAQTRSSVRSVRRIEREAPVTASETAALARARGLRRPSTAAPWAERIAQGLAEEDHLPGVELLRRAREAGYRGGQSALYELIRRLRPVERVPPVRFEGAAGEFSQPDVGSVTVRYRSGAIQRGHFFASRLKSVFR